MFQWIGISLVIAAWAVPILFALTLSFLFSFAVFRPLFLAWSHAWDAAAARLNYAAQAMAERVLSRTYVYAVRHTRPD